MKSSRPTVVALTALAFAASALASPAGVAREAGPQVTVERVTDKTRDVNTKFGQNRAGARAADLVSARFRMVTDKRLKATLVTRGATPDKWSGGFGLNGPGFYIDIDHRAGVVKNRKGKTCFKAKVDVSEEGTVTKVVIPARCLAAPKTPIRIYAAYEGSGAKNYGLDSTPKTAPILLR